MKTGGSMERRKAVVRKSSAAFFSRICLPVLLLWLVALAPIAKAQDKEGEFEKIARQNRAVVPGLQKNPAPVLPQTVLPWDAKPGKAFAPGKSIQTQQQLDAELKRMRKQYLPFLANYAPSLPAYRQRVMLDTFQWKLLATEMARDANGNLYPLPALRNVADSTSWKTVTIPHYEGPINKAEAVYKRTLLISKEQMAAPKLILHFNAVDYIAEIFVNGKPAGGHTGLFGAFEFDIKPLLHAGSNTLEIKVYNDAVMMGDNFFLGENRKFGKKLAACGGPGWNEPGYAKGWSVCPPGFGIWQDCYIESRSDCYVNDLFVRPLVDALKAEVSLEVPVTAKNIEVYYSLYGQNFKAKLAGKKQVDSSEISISKSTAPDGFVTLRFVVDIPSQQLRLWSPETPWLYQLQVALKQNGNWTDAAGRQFGMRSFVQSDTSTPRGRFYLNGKEVKLRGANMMGNIMQCVMRKDYQQLIDDILLAKIAGMNFWRMTQQPCQQEAYEYFDKLGMMAQTDMPAFNGYRSDVVPEVKAQFSEMMRLVRGHPSNALISYLNEPDFTKPVMLSREQHQDLFYGFDSTAQVMNPGQVCKWVDGDYVNLSPRFSDHHDYDIWYGNGIRKRYFGEWHDTRAGWMYGCGEFGAEALDAVDFMQKHYPVAWLKTGMDGKWDPRQVPGCQTPKTGLKFMQLKDSSMQDWVSSSRQHQYWAIRLFTEALRRNNQLNSFAVHLLIDAWPAGWMKSLMDADRQAKPGYFAYLNALRPIAVNLRPDSFYGYSGDSSSIAVFVCNDKAEAVDNAKLRYQVLQQGLVLFTGSIPVSIPPGEAGCKGYLKFPLPQVRQRQSITVRAGLFDAKGNLIQDSAFDCDVFPSADKGKKPDHPGGFAQRLIAQ